MFVWALLALLLEVPARGQEACSFKVGQIPVTMVGTRPIATVGINGTEVPLLVDSGAFFSALTDAATAQLELPVKRFPGGMKVSGLTGRIDARMTTVKVMQLLKAEIPNVDFIVGGNEPGGGAMGLLGRNVLALKDTEYDLAHGMVRLTFPEGNCKGRNMAYWAGDTPVVELPLRYERSRPAIKATAKLNGVDVGVLFDTGAMSVVSLAAAARRCTGRRHEAHRPDTRWGPWRSEGLGSRRYRSSSSVARRSRTTR